MKDYKRLTTNNRDEYNPEYEFCCYCKFFGGEPRCCNNPIGTCKNHNRFLGIYNRLAELEDKIENGTLIESPCYNKSIKFYLNSKEISFEKLSEIPQMMTDRENHTITNMVLNYIGKNEIYFYTKTEQYTAADGEEDDWGSEEIYE